MSEVRVLDWKCPSCLNVCNEDVDVTTDENGVESFDAVSSCGWFGNVPVGGRGPLSESETKQYFDSKWS